MERIFVIAVAGVALFIGALAGCSSDKGSGPKAKLTFDGKEYPMERVTCKTDGNVVNIHAGNIMDDGKVIDTEGGNGFMAQVIDSTRSENVAIEYDKKTLWTIAPSVKKAGNTYTFNGEDMDSKKPFEMVATCP